MLRQVEATLSEWVHGMGTTTKTKIGWFHQFVTYQAYRFEDTNVNEYSRTVAIVELEDGSLIEVDINAIRFVRPPDGAPFIESL